MNKTILFLALGVLLGGLLLAGCAAEPEITPAAAPPPTPAVVVGEGGNGDTVSVVQAAAEARFPLPAPEQEEVVIVSSDNCIACHTDEETLKELAVEPEEKESLSEGEG
ncbi:MAG TPA: hypothetical protein ENK56_01445 [Chloroflexi bacterium]|nr:hypothetical protein [Chloroflexota bacterium]